MRPLRIASAALVTLAIACTPEEPAKAPPPVCPSVAPPPQASSDPAVTAPPALPPAVSDSDEGMWLVNDLPMERIKSRYSFTPSQAWLDHVRLSSVRVGRGCSGSFVSPNGLVMTNHHCAEGCITDLSSKKKDYSKDGFYAKTDKEEVKCAGMEINQLTAISDVTERVNKATAGLTDKAYADAQKAEISRVEKECGTSDDVRCDVVTLYHGGRYNLYKYHRYQDVRLVFAPETSIAFFGGDPDNFNFPRFDLDVTFLRAYEKGAPVKAENFFAWSKGGAKAGELTFVSGHPGRTSRELTLAELAFQRDVFLPEWLVRSAELRGHLVEWGERGAEQKRIVESDLAGLENGLKVRVGAFQALTDPEFMGRKAATERAFRARLAADPAHKEAADAYDAIAAATKLNEQLRPLYLMLEMRAGLRSDLFEHARDLVRAAAEAQKPNELRLVEYSEAKMGRLKASVLASAPIYEDFEILKLSASLTKMREELGADEPHVKKILGQKSPKELATELVKGSKLKDVKVRKALLEGGKAAVDASTDTMIAFAKLVDGDAREARKAVEERVDAVLKKSGEKIATARFALYGTSLYPDATGTLRLSFGHVEGWKEGGKDVPPFTTIGGAFERATGRDPFQLPKSWLAAKDKLDAKMPFNFVTTNDIIGGNSGSPMFNANGEIVGLIFDGNIHSLGGDYGFDPRVNRAVAVQSDALLHALDKVYGASRVLAEIKR